MQIKFRSPLPLILALAVVLRLGAALWLGDTLDGPQQARVYDQHSYHALAQSLLAGDGYSFDRPWYPFRDPPGTPTAHWSFLYPLFLSGVYAVAGPHPLAARLVQALIAGLLTTWLVFILGRRLFDERVGLLAAGLSAVYPYFVFHDAALMTEPFFIAAVLGSLILSLNLAAGLDLAASPSSPPSRPGAAGRRDLLEWLALGAVLGAGALLRQTLLLWAPFLYLYVLTFQRSNVLTSQRSNVLTFKRSNVPTFQHAFLSLVVIALFILPWTVRNYRLYEAFLPLNSNAGYALYSANHPDHGTQFDQDYAAPLPADLLGRGLNEAQWNSELTRRGLAFITADPLRYLRLSLDRAAVFFNFWYSAESSPGSNLMRVFSFGLYLPFFAAGLVLSAREWRRCSLVYLFVVVFSLMHVLVWASIRYRLPVDAVLMPFAALAVEKLGRRSTQIIQDKRRFNKLNHAKPG